jgi:hypothetical protein
MTEIIKYKANTPSAASTNQENVRERRNINIIFNRPTDNSENLRFQNSLGEFQTNLANRRTATGRLSLSNDDDNKTVISFLTEEANDIFPQVEEALNDSGFNADINFIKNGPDRFEPEKTASIIGPVELAAPKKLSPSLSST